MSAVPPEVREAVHDRSGGRCEARTEVCTGGGYFLHHKVMRSHGGSHSEGNLLDCCRSCHDYIHAHPTEAYERGWLIRGVA
jgi:hypothetical protein